MKKIYYLSTCNTCTKIMKQLGIGDDFIRQDIKTEAITEAQLEEMRAMTDSYESLFSRRSRQYRTMGLHQMTLNEEDYKRLILKEYTFLKRPVIVINNVISIGNAQSELEKVRGMI